MDIPMRNTRQRQTYYGTYNLVTKTGHLKAFSAGNSAHTVEYLQYLQGLYPGKTLWIFWDNASYHRSAIIKRYLEQMNKDRDEKNWKILFIPFNPYAPEQNPMEDLWLKGKNFLRKNAVINKTFARVKQCFLQFLSTLHCDLNKLNWYFPQKN